MDLITALHHRRSTPSRLLAEPGPDDLQLHQLLSCAVRAPDHGKLVPWRFLAIRGEARRHLGEFLAGRTRARDPEALPAVIDKDRNRFNHAPLVITVIGRLTPGHKIPMQEQLLSGGAVCLLLLQAADALGFGAQWLTGWAAYDPQVAARLGLRENECVLGFIHIGTAQAEAAERERPDPRTLLSELGP